MWTSKTETLKVLAKSIPCGTCRDSGLCECEDIFVKKSIELAQKAIVIHEEIPWLQVGFKCKKYRADFDKLIDLYSEE